MKWVVCYFYTFIMMLGYISEMTEEVYELCKSEKCWPWSKTYCEMAEQIEEEEYDQ